MHLILTIEGQAGISAGNSGPAHADAPEARGAGCIGVARKSVQSRRADRS
ncbi:MAG: hypothetical protein ACKVZJ_00155 [Phycisphaerales bacterium]